MNTYEKQGEGVPPRNGSSDPAAPWRGNRLMCKDLGEGNEVDFKEVARVAMRALARGLAGEQRQRKTDGHAEVRAAEASHDRVGHADDFAFPIEERPARTARRGLRVVDDLVFQHVADVSLRGER